MPFALRKKDKKPPDIQAVLKQDLVEQGLLPDDGQGDADPTAEPILESSSETVSTVIAEPTENATQAEIVSVTEPEPVQPTSMVSESTDTGPADVVKQEIVGRGEELEQEILPRVFIETCEAAVVGPPAAVAAAVPSTALAVVAEKKEVALPRKLSDRTIKAWRAGKKVDKDQALLPNSPNFPDNFIITLHVTPSPKGTGPTIRYAKYRTGMTVAEYIKACERMVTTRISHLDLKWDSNHGFISVSAPEVVESAATEAA